MPSDIDETKTEALHLACTLQHALLTFLRKVYMGDAHQDINPEFLATGNGIWSIDRDKDLTGGHEHLALFPALSAQLQGFSKALPRLPPLCIKDYSSFITHAMLPLLQDYYSMPNFCRSECRLAHNVRIAEEIWDVLNTITKKGSDVMRSITEGEQAELLAIVFGVMNKMVQNSSVAREEVPINFQNRPERKLVDLASCVSECVRIGFMSFRSRVASSLGEREHAHSLPLLLSADEEAVIYSDLIAPGSEGAVDISKNPKVASLIIDCLPILRADAADDQILLDVLSLLRGAMYLSSPLKPLRPQSEDSAESLQQRWHLFKNLSSVRHSQSSDEAVLSWIQSKFDALGCTQVALFLCSHVNVAVQVLLRVVSCLACVS